MFFWRKSWRSDFPILKSKTVYLDSGATSQKPKIVLKTVKHFLETSNANVHRGVYQWSARATEWYEGARKTVADFIKAQPNEIVFVRNATEAINLVSRSWGDVFVKKGDLIVSTVMEHHSNIVPWQALANRTGAHLAYIPITKEGLLDRAEASKLLAKKPKLLAVTHVSNVLGTINPVKELVAEAHKHGTLVLVDAAQSIPHLPVDVKELDADFLVFSGHKLFAPSVGVLYAKKQLLDVMEPFLFGGDMIKEVSLEKSSWNAVPWKFEAGTPAIPEAIGLAAAITYVKKIGVDKVAVHDAEVIAYAYEKLSAVPGVTIYGPKERSGVISFNLGDVHSHDVATVLDEDNIAIRSGHHCCMPLMQALKIGACARISIALYSTKDDIDKFIKALVKAKKVFRV